MAAFSKKYIRFSNHAWKNHTNLRFKRNQANEGEKNQKQNLQNPNPLCGRLGQREQSGNLSELCLTPGTGNFLPSTGISCSLALAGGSRVNSKTKGSEQSGRDHSESFRESSPDQHN